MGRIEMRRTSVLVLLLVSVVAIAGARSLCAAEPEAGGKVEPKWLAGKPRDAWFAIPGTSGTGGTKVDAFCGMTVKESSCEIVIAAAGGHAATFDNRVVSIDLRSDAPVWIQRHAPSPKTPNDVPYNPDGLPAARHTYQSTFHVPATDRVMLFGCRFTHPGAHEFPTVDGFNLKTNTWDPAGTYPNIPAGGGYGVVQDSATGDIWTQSLKKWCAASNTWSSPITKFAQPGVRFPYAYDSRRGQLFGLNCGDGQGYGDLAVVAAVRVPVKGKESLSVTLNPGKALEQFKKDAPVYAGMDYDPDNDRFLFYCGVGAGAGRIYVIKPNDGKVWDMDLYAFGAGSTPPPPIGGAGINNRFRYFPRFKGFVLLASAALDLYFIRTSDLSQRPQGGR